MDLKADPTSCGKPGVDVQLPLGSQVVVGSISQELRLYVETNLIGASSDVALESIKKSTTINLTSDTKESTAKTLLRSETSFGKAKT